MQGFLQRETIVEPGAPCVDEDTLQVTVDGSNAQLPRGSNWTDMGVAVRMLRRSASSGRPLSVDARLVYDEYRC